MATPAEDLWNKKKKRQRLCFLPEILSIVQGTMTGKEQRGAIMEVTVLFLVFHHGHLSSSGKRRTPMREEWCKLYSDTCIHIAISCGFLIHSSVGAVAFI